MAQRESKLARNTLNDIAPNNSDKAARGDAEKTEDKKKLKPLVKKGNVTKKKRSIGDKFKDAFLGESENLGDYVLYDVLVPAFRDTISDMGFGIIERLFGNGRSRYGRGDSRIVRIEVDPMCLTIVCQMITEEVLDMIEGTLIGVLVRDMTLIMLYLQISGRQKTSWHI